MSWRARAVFVSGTFRDMHEERDLLGARVFPALGEKLAEHYTTLERVDLRVGVETRGLADDHAKQELVLKVCLDDVKRCRPFLIVLVGDRYGWVPPIERARAAADEAGFQTTVDGKSVTALEIEFGLWGDPDQQTRSRIYFRQLDYTGMVEADAIVYSDERAAVSALVPPADREQAARRAEALGALKRRLRDDPVLGPRCRGYTARWDPASRTVTGLGRFVEDVIDDLLPEMIAEADLQVAAAQAGRLATPLEQFVAERSHGFKGRATLVSKLCEFATGQEDADTPRGLVIAGASGAGKSAIFARVFEELTAGKRNNLWLLAYAVGIDPRSALVVSLLEDWVALLSDRLGIPNPLPPPGESGAVDSHLIESNDKRPRPEEVFADLLSRAASRARVVLLLDAIDRFERTPQTDRCTWLPARLPTNVRLIATVVSGPQSEALALRPDFAVEPLVALTPDEAREIAQGVYARYHRQPNEDAVRALIEKPGPDKAPAHGNPLWMVTALEELNLLDGDDFRRAEARAETTDEDRLHAMVMDEGRALPADIEGLYARVFRRAGRRVSDDPGEGAALTRAFATLIALSRGGLRERDLAALVPGVARVFDPSGPAFVWDALGFASLRRALRAHLVRRGEDDRWEFHHRQARAAAERAYATDAGKRQQIEALVADHLLGLPAEDPLREREAMYHLIQADAREKAAALYAGELTPGGLTGCREALTLHALSHEGLEWVAGLLDLDTLGPDMLAALGERYLFDLNPALANAAPLDVRNRLARAVESRFRKLKADHPARVDWLRNLAVSHLDLGEVLRVQGDLPGALEAFRAGHTMANLLASASPSNSDWQRDLSFSHGRLGVALTEQGDLPGALEAFRASLAIAQRLAAADPGSTARQGDLSVSHGRLGVALKAQGDLPGALEAFRASLAIKERLAATDSDNTTSQDGLAYLYRNIGEVLRAQGDLRAARAAFHASHAIRQRLVDVDPGKTSWQDSLAESHISLGDVLMTQGDLRGAHAAFQASHAIRQRLVSQDTGNAFWQGDLAISHDRLGVVLMALGDLTGARAAFEASYLIRQQAAAVAPSDAGSQSQVAIGHERLGQVLRALGDLPGALAAFRASLAIREQLAAADPTSGDRQRALTISHNALGDVLTAQGDLPGAVTAFRTSLGIREQLAAADPSNKEWQRDLSISHERIGDALARQGDLAAALAAIQVCHAIRRQLAVADPNNTEWQSDLSISHEKLGDVLMAQGDLRGAHTAFLASLAIREQLAAADPSNANWQRLQIISNERMANLITRVNRFDPAALTYWRACHRILRSMKAHGMFLDPPLVQFLERLDRALAD